MEKSEIQITKTDDLVPSELCQKFWLVSADMGYGHQRALSPLKALANGGNIINANKALHASVREHRLWNEIQKTYEFMSRAGNLPVIGNLMSRLLDGILYIPNYYPFRERYKPTLQVKYLKNAIKNGLCDGIVSQIRRPELPVVTSFYAPAIAAEMAGHNKIFCVICDSDLSRAWAAEKASESQILYFAPGSVSVHRLISYGVPEKNILLTGFPLPLELMGDRNLNILKANLRKRLKNLDPEQSFDNLYKHSVDAFLKKEDFNNVTQSSSKKQLTITYAVGGAGAQKDTGNKIMKSLKDEINNGKIKLNLVAGTRSDLVVYFDNARRNTGINKENINIIWGETNEIYFDLFNKSLHNTDILWTKPSELSFYCALGIPVIMTPAIGPQEKCNRRWLREIGAGIKQQNPEYTNQWLPDLLARGRLAEAAWNGFLKARKYGTYNIIDFLHTGTFNSSNDPLKR